MTRTHRLRRIDLIIVDGQNDFLDPAGALYVRNAEVEAEKLAAMIDSHRDRITMIHATMDAHHVIDVAHPQMWIDEHGDHPEPFTTITDADVVSRRWSCALTGYFDATKKITYHETITSYVQCLGKNGRYQLCIWPPHCLIGSAGQNIYPPLLDAYMRWAEQRPGWINFITKGEYPFSEHYSAIQADVPEPNVPKSQINAELLTTLGNADIVLWAGWAGSHALANTCRDSINFFGAGENSLSKKSVLLTDACAAVGDAGGSNVFQDVREAFIKEMMSRGVRLATTEDVFA